MSIEGLNSNESLIKEHTETQLVEFENSNNLEMFIKILDDSLPNTPEDSRFLKKCPNILDLNTSKSLLPASPLLTEELLINDNIDFLACESVLEDNSCPASKSITMNYTKSDIMTPYSSVFQSFENLDILLNSLPQSNSGSLLMQYKSFQSQDVRVFAERSDLQRNMLRIPPFCLESSTKLLNFKKYRDEWDDKEHIANEVLAEIQSPSIMELKKSVAWSSEVFTTGRNLELFDDNKISNCSCTWCNIY